jgi:hypothetical protein
MEGLQSLWEGNLLSAMVKIVKKEGKIRGEKEITWNHDFDEGGRSAYSSRVAAILPIKGHQ